MRVTWKRPAEATLLTVDFKCVDDLLLAGQQSEFAMVEGILGQSLEERIMGVPFGRNPLATVSDTLDAPFYASMATRHGLPTLLQQQILTSATGSSLPV